MHMGKWFWLYPRISGYRKEGVWVGKPDREIVKAYHVKKHAEAERLLVTASQQTEAIQTVKPVEGRPITCVHCGYEWKTRSSSYRLQCGECGGWTMTKNVKIPLKIPVLAR